MHHTVALAQHLLDVSVLTAGPAFFLYRHVLGGTDEFQLKIQGLDPGIQCNGDRLRHGGDRVLNRLP